MPRPTVVNPVAVRWWIAAAFIACAMIFGGGSRADVLSNIWLRPIAILVFVYAAFGIRSEDLRAHRFLVIMAAAVTILTLLHLVPLPPDLWRSLPGRDLIADIDRAAGLGEIWRPLSMVPTTTWNALYALSVPLAVLALLLPMGDRHRFDLLKVIGGILVLSAFMGLVQATGATLSFFDISNPNAGLFANRNHQAVLVACLVPIAAVLAFEPGLKRFERKLRWTLAAILTLALAPILMVTGSRAGIAAAALAVLSVPLVVPVPWRDGNSGKVSRWALGGLAVGALLVVGLAWIAVESGRNLALLRFIELDATDDMRFSVWQVSWELTRAYLPLGSGIGSFAEVYQVGEPDRLLMPRYWNHAHNDWLEVALTAGLPGVFLLIVSVAAFGFAAVRAFIVGKQGHPAILLARLGCVILTILGLASVFDYPIRTPAAACVLVFAAVMAAKGRAARASDTEQGVI